MIVSIARVGLESGGRHLGEKIFLGMPLSVLSICYTISDPVTKGAFQYLANLSVMLSRNLLNWRHERYRRIVRCAKIVSE